MKGTLRAALTGWSWPVHTGLSDDLDLLMRALGPAPGKRFLSISAHGAGEAALCLAADGAERVLVADIGDAALLKQLLTLKVAAAQTLERRAYLCLMGLRQTASHQRGLAVSRILATLAEADRRYWLRRRHWLTTGLYLACQQTCFLHWAGLLLWLLMPRRARHQLVHADSPDIRVRIFRRYVCRPWLRRAIDWLGARVNLFYPAAEWRHAAYPQKFNRDPFPFFEHLIATGMAHNPLFAHYFLRPNECLSEHLLPPHLRRSGYAGLQTVAGRLQVQVTPPGAIPDLQCAERTMNGAYLSNCIDYLDATGRDSLLRAVSRALRPGAPVLIYSSEEYEKVSPGCGLVRDDGASTRLAALDRARIYARIGLFRAAPS